MHPRSLTGLTRIGAVIIAFLSTCAWPFLALGSSNHGGEVNIDLPAWSDADRVRLLRQIGESVDKQFSSDAAPMRERITSLVAEWVSRHGRASNDSIVEHWQHEEIAWRSGIARRYLSLKNDPVLLGQRDTQIKNLSRATERAVRNSCIDNVDVFSARAADSFVLQLEWLAHTAYEPYLKSPLSAGDFSKLLCSLSEVAQQAKGVSDPDQLGDVLAAKALGQWSAPVPPELVAARNAVAARDSDRERIYFTEGPNEQAFVRVNVEPSLFFTEQLSAVTWMLADLRACAERKLPVALALLPLDSGEVSLPLNGMLRMVLYSPTGRQAMTGLFEVVVTPEGVACLETTHVPGNSLFNFFANRTGATIGINDAGWQFVSYMGKIRYVSNLRAAEPGRPFGSLYSEVDPFWATVLLNDLRMRTPLPTAPMVESTVALVGSASSLPFRDFHAAAIAPRQTVGQYGVLFHDAAGNKIGQATIKTGADRIRVRMVLPEVIVPISVEIVKNSGKGQPVAKQVETTGLYHRGGRIIIDNYETSAATGWSLRRRCVFDGEGRPLYKLLFNPRGTDERESSRVIRSDVDIESEISERRATHSAYLALKASLHDMPAAGGLRAALDFVALNGRSGRGYAHRHAASYAAILGDALWDLGHRWEAKLTYQQIAPHFSRILRTDDLIAFAEEALRDNRYSRAEAIAEYVWAERKSLYEVLESEALILLARSRYYAVKNDPDRHKDDAVKYYREFAERFPDEVGSVLAKLRMGEVED